MIRFGGWEPDKPALGNPGVTVAKNCFPRGEGTYGALQGLEVQSTALNAYCQGAYTDRATDGTVYNFAGDATRLYLLDGAGDFMDVSRLSGGLYTGDVEDNWDFITAAIGTAKYVIASNGADAPQLFAPGSSSNFELLDSLAPKWKTAAFVQRFVIAGNITESGVRKPLTLQWSAVGDPQDWPVPGSADATSKQSAQITLSYGQEIRKVTGGVGGADGLIFCEKAIYRLVYVGGGKIFQPTEIARDFGTIAKGSIALAGNRAFFLSEHGVEWCDGSQVQSIGQGHVDRWLRNMLDYNYLHRITAIADPKNEMVIWSFAGTDNTGGTPNYILIYNWAADRFSYAQFDHDLIYRGAAGGYSIDDLDSINPSLDSLPASLDDTSWTGGVQQTAYFTTAHKLAFPTGDNLEATIETAELDGEGRRMFASGIRVLADADSSAITVTLRYRDNPFASLTDTSAATVDADGCWHFHQAARYMRAKVVVAAATDWTHLMGFEPGVNSEGKR